MSNTPTHTPRHNLYKPYPGQHDVAEELNQNMDKIDHALSALETGKANTNHNHDGHHALANHGHGQYLQSGDFNTLLTSNNAFQAMIARIDKIENTLELLAPNLEGATVSLDINGWNGHVNARIAVRNASGNIIFVSSWTLEIYFGDYNGAVPRPPEHDIPSSTNRIGFSRNELVGLTGNILTIRAMAQSGQSIKFSEFMQVDLARIDGTGVIIPGDVCIGSNNMGNITIDSIRNDMLLLKADLDKATADIGSLYSTIEGIHIDDIALSIAENATACTILVNKLQHSVALAGTIATIRGTGTGTVDVGAGGGGGNME